MTTNSESEIESVIQQMFNIPFKDIDGNYIAMSPTAAKAIEKIQAEEKFNKELFTPLGLCNIFPTLRKGK